MNYIMIERNKGASHSPYNTEFINHKRHFKQDPSNIPSQHTELYCTAKNLQY
jgi:hypothetical protein